MCWSLINVYVFKWVIWIPFAVFYVYLLYFIGLRYILKSTCYLWNTHISMKSYQLNQITFFNSSNNSYHFKLMGCSSLPRPHRYRHKSQDEPVTKVTTIHFTPERSSPPVDKVSFELEHIFKCDRNILVLTTTPIHKDISGGPQCFTAWDNKTTSTEFQGNNPQSLVTVFGWRLRPPTIIRRDGCGGPQYTLLPSHRLLVVGWQWGW